MDFMMDLAGALKGSRDFEKDGNSFIQHNWAVYQEQLETFIRDSPSVFLVGSQFSAADLLWYTTVLGVRAMGMTLDLSAALRKLIDTITQLDGVINFLNDPKKNLF
jgi:glutathione S-transferase